MSKVSSDGGRIVVTLVVVLSGLGASTGALAQDGDAGSGGETAEGGASSVMDEEDVDDDRARRHFQAGRSLYDVGRFPEAAREFDEAYQLSGRPELLYNVYVAYRDAGEIEKAAPALRGYLEQSEEVTDRVNLEARLRSMEEQLARRAESEPTEPQSGGDPTASTPPTDPGPLPFEPTQPSGDGMSPWPWVVVGVGGAMILAGSITGIVALGKTAEIEDQCPRDVCPPEYTELEEDRDDARTFVTATDILLLGGIAVAAGGLVWALLGGDDGERAEAMPQATAGCGPTGCAAEMRWSF